MKITEIQGASSCWPKKEEGVTLLLDNKGKEYAPLKEHFKWGKNVMLSQVEKIDIGMDKYEVMAKLHELPVIGNIYRFFDDGTKLMIAESFCQTQDKIIVMRKIE